MSMVPDERPESFLEIPANTQENLYKVLRALSISRPDLVAFTGCRSSLWERNFEITPAGGTYLAELIADDLMEKYVA